MIEGSRFWYKVISDQIYQNITYTIHIDSHVLDRQTDSVVDFLVSSSLPFFYFVFFRNNNRFIISSGGISDDYVSDLIFIYNITSPRYEWIVVSYHIYPILLLNPSHLSWRRNNTQFVQLSPTSPQNNRTSLPSSATCPDQVQGRRQSDDIIVRPSLPFPLISSQDR